MFRSGRGVSLLVRARDVRPLMTCRRGRRRSVMRGRPFLIKNATGQQNDGAQKNLFHFSSFYHKRSRFSFVTRSSETGAGAAAGAVSGTEGEAPSPVLNLRAAINARRFSGPLYKTLSAS